MCGDMGDDDDGDDEDKDDGFAVLGTHAELLCKTKHQGAYSHVTEPVLFSSQETGLVQSNVSHETPYSLTAHSWKIIAW